MNIIAIVLVGIAFANLSICLWQLWERDTEPVPIWPVLPDAEKKARRARWEQARNR